MLTQYSNAVGMVDRETFIQKISEADFPVIKNNKKVEYYNIPAAFDIEVSSFYYNRGEKCACMYIWMFGIYNYVTYGRTWEEFLDLLSQVREKLYLAEDRLLVVYIHNFAYEFQFMRKRLKWDKLFFLEKRKPIYGISQGIEFRCSYKLSSKSLAKVGDDLQKYKCEKKVGDLDYSLIRTSNSRLTEKELGYCENDIRVVLCYIQEKIEQDGDITRIPLTNTGYVRNYCRKACFRKWRRYRDFMSALTLEPDEYQDLKLAFSGGFTHASYKYSRRVVNDVGSFDFTSSYPAVMLLEKFPMSKGKLVESMDEEKFEWYRRHKCCLIIATFSQLTAKVDYDHPISSSKFAYERQKKDPSLIKDNGRVVYAEEATLGFTETDLDVFERFYSWESMEIHKMWVYDKDYLPTAFVKAVLDLYKMKTELKDVEGEEVNYMISKNMLNSSYGMMVTDIVRELVGYDELDFYTAEKPDLNDAISKYNKSVKRFLFYPWGVWVTSYARRNLFSGILACGEDYIYSDTDSIKVRNWKDHMDYIEEYNKKIQLKMQQAAKAHHLDPSVFSPLNKKGKAKPIGVWDFEGVYKRFKTVGAKRYIVEYQDGTYGLTIAGVNKKKGMAYIEKTYKDPMDGLNEGLKVPGEYSGRLLLDYCGDRSCEGDIVDYEGIPGHFHELSYIHMEQTTYELTYSADYKAFIDDLLEVMADEEYA